MLKTIDKVHIKGIARAIRKAQKKGKIEKPEENEIEAINGRLEEYKLLCAIPDGRHGIYYTFLENQREYVFKVLNKDFTERKSESYSKRQWRKGIATFLEIIQSYAGVNIFLPREIGFHHIDGSKFARSIFLRKIQAKEDPDLVSRITSAKRFDGQVLSVVDNEIDYKVITQTNDRYGIITLDPDTLEEKASEYYLFEKMIPTKKDKIKSFYHKAATGLVGLAITITPYYILSLVARSGGVENRTLADLIAFTSFMTGLAGLGLLWFAPFARCREHIQKEINMEKFLFKLSKYASSQGKIGLRLY